MLTLYQSATSVCSIKVRLVLSEKGFAWTPRNLDLRAGDQHQPEYLKLNPSGVVPTLDDNGKILVESSVIMQYLDDLEPKPTLQPRDPFERAQMRLWMKLVDETLHPCNITLTYAILHREKVLALAPKARDEYFTKIPDAGRRERQRRAILEGLETPDAVEAIRAYSRSIATMEEALSSKAWLACNQWSLADAALTPYLDRLDTLGLSCLWSSFPRVANWIHRVRARESYNQAVRQFNPTGTARSASVQNRDIQRLREIAAPRGRGS